MFTIVRRYTPAVEEYSIDEVRHDAHDRNGWKVPHPVQAGGESLGRSGEWVHTLCEIAVPKRPSAGDDSDPKKLGLAKR
jgi:nucleotidyltransferase/DNA polymerase involved in DNA repair